MDRAIIVDHLMDISFTIQTGEIVGLVGPIGAGKTTIIKILSGLVRLKSGFVSVLDNNPWDKSDDFLKQTSVIFGNKSQLILDLPAIYTFELNKAIYQIKDRDYRKNLDELISLLGVSKTLDVEVKELSPEQKIKMEFVASLIYKPKVLFLDEMPFNPDFLYEYNKRNRITIFLTSPNINNLNDIVRRVIAIDNRKLIFDGPLEKLK